MKQKIKKIVAKIIIFILFHLLLGTMLVYGIMTATTLN